MIIPDKLDIEVVRGVCTATCPMCPIEETRYNSSVMNFEMFKKIIDRFGKNIKKINRVNLVGIGEILVDVKLNLKIEYLKSKGLNNICFPTNASLLKTNVAEKVLDAGINEVIFGIDSMNKAIYEKVRRDLIFEEVLENTLNYIKIRDNGDYDSRIMVRMILSKDNKDEWNSYKEYWSKFLNFEKGDMALYFPEHNWSDHDYPKAKSEPTVVEKNCKCIYVYDRMLLDAHGNVRLCCIDINSTFFKLGNVLQEDPITLFNSKNFLNVRELMDQGKINDIKPCKTCNVPLMRSDRGFNNDNEFDIVQ